MNKKVRTGIIAGSCAVVLLAGALVALKLTEPAETEEENNLSTTSSPAEKTSKLLYDKNPADISSVELKNAEGTFKVERYADDFWTIPEISGLPLDYNTINTILESCASVTAEQTVVEKADDLSVYGLAEPQVTATAVFDGSAAETKTILIGDETPKTGYYYFKFADSDPVYTIKKGAVSHLFYGEYDCLNHVMYATPVDTAPEDDYNPAKINSITISRKDIDYDIKLEYDVRQDYAESITGNSSTHVLSEPVSLDLNPDKAETTLNGIFSLSAVDIAAVYPDEAALAEYGLDDPYGKVTFDINAGVMTILMGDPYKNEEGKQEGYYCKVDGIDVIYKFTNESFPWIDVMPLDITTSLITSTYIYSINTIDIECEGTSYSYQLEGEDAKSLAVKLDGNEYADTDKFKTFYQFILRAPAEELYTENNTDEARITITMTTDYGKDVLEFITDEDRMTVIRLNGRTSFRCRTAYADRLAENILKMVSGEELIETW